MKILAIETSCDETAVTILKCEGGLDSPKFKILGNSLISQIELHREYGGVYPTLAKREHQKNLPLLLEKTMKESGCNPKDVDYIVVTSGPGLEPALWVGIMFAEDLGEKWGVPVVSVNHMEGHIYSVLTNENPDIKFPALALLVSGGHTELVKMDGHGEYEIIGKTRDDAAGEAFDKVARLLDLPYPGGPKVSALAELHRGKGSAPTITFPRPMIHSKDFDFSFSGLKTSVLYKLKELGEIDESLRKEIARSFEDAVVETLVDKTRRAIEEFGPRTLIVAGGVSLNKHLRRKIGELRDEYPDLEIRFPEPSLTGDNAVMIGMAGYMGIITNNRQPTTNDGRRIIAKGNLVLGQTF